jgi:phosphatidylserine/phosphatidylglycerophosphate/cardiolipin synthase-like enzyme
LKTDRLPSGEETKAAFEALAHVGILRRDGAAFRLEKARLTEKIQYCRGVYDTLRVRERQEMETTRLCATLAIDLDQAVENALRKHTCDLRSTLVDLIAGAQEWIILASPFWDHNTATELAALLARRLEAGVRVDILGRFEKGDDSGRGALQRKLTGYEKCQFFAWHETNLTRSSRAQTFHFKTAVADSGARAYLGTANLTTSGLRSVMELGVIVTGKTARQLSDILKVILSIARPLTDRRG